MAGKIEKGDFILLDYVGRIKETGKVFDLTSEEQARQENVFDPQGSYGPRTVIIGAGHLIKGLEDALIGSKVGGSMTVELPPDEAFGARDPKRRKLVPMREFKKQRINPYPGMSVSLNNDSGVVATVSGGRVVVDFNHPLAGKTLVYEVDVRDKVKKEEEMVQSVIKINLDLPVEGFNITVGKKDVSIIVPEEPSVFPRSYKQKIATEIMEYVKKDEVRFLDVFRKSNNK